MRQDRLHVGRNQDRKRDESSKTTMLFFIVGFFCTCHVWYPITRLISCHFHSVFWSRMYTYMYCVNNAINFVIYCVWWKAYRRRLKHVLKELREIRERFPKLRLWNNGTSVRAEGMDGISL